MEEPPTLTLARVLAVGAVAHVVLSTLTLGEALRLVVISKELLALHTLRPCHITLDGGGAFAEDAALAALLRSPLCAGGALRVLDVTPACPPVLAAAVGDEGDGSDGEGGGGETLTVEGLLHSLSGGAFPAGLDAAALAARRSHQSFAASMALTVAAASILGNANLVGGGLPDAPRPPPLTVALAAQPACDGIGVDLKAVAALALPPCPPPVGLKELILWRPRSRRCLPLSPVQTLELAATCEALPGLRRVQALIHNVGHGDEAESVRGVLDAAATLPAGSALALAFPSTKLSKASLDAVAAALRADARVVWVEARVEAGVSAQPLHDAAAARAAVGAPVTLKLA